MLEAFGQVANACRRSITTPSSSRRSRTPSARPANRDLTRRRYDEGNVGVLQVLDAERRYQQARLGYVRAQAQRYLDTAQLFLALGSGIGAPASATTALQNPAK